MKTANAIAYWNATADSYAERVTIRTDDFHYGPLIPGDRELGLLPALQPGQRALELGCGAAQNSVYLTRAGALACTAWDGAPRLLSRARKLCCDAGVEVTLEQVDLDALPTKEMPPFDLIHSVHALQFVSDPVAVLQWAAAHLAPTGHLVIATHHPLFAGEWLELDDEGMGLFLSDYFEPVEDARDTDHGRVASRAYPISQWFNWLSNAGLVVELLAEPRPAAPPETAPYVSDDWLALAGQLRHIPATLILVARRKSVSEPA